MPRPTNNDDEKRFMNRCIPKVLEDGTATSDDQAVAICYSLWEDRNKSFNWQTDHWFALLAKGVINNEN